MALAHPGEFYPNRLPNKDARAGSENRAGQPDGTESHAGEHKSDSTSSPNRLSRFWHSKIGKRVVALTSSLAVVGAASGTAYAMGRSGEHGANRPPAAGAPQVPGQKGMESTAPARLHIEHNNVPGASPDLFGPNFAALSPDAQVQRSLEITNLKSDQINQLSPVDFAVWARDYRQMQLGLTGADLSINFVQDQEFFDPTNTSVDRKHMADWLSHYYSAAVTTLAYELQVNPDLGNDPRTVLALFGNESGSLPMDTAKAIAESYPTTKDTGPMEYVNRLVGTGVDSGHMAQVLTTDPTNIQSGLEGGNGWFTFNVRDFKGNNLTLGVKGYASDVNYSGDQAKVYSPDSGPGTPNYPTVNLPTIQYS